MRIDFLRSVAHGVVACGLVLGIACGARSAIETGTETETDEPASCEPDTAVACFSGPAESRGVGACRDGERRCEDESAACVGEVLPSVEDCGAPGNESCDGDEHICTGTPGWALSYGGSGHEYLFDVTVDAAGDIVAVGALNSPVELGGVVLEDPGVWQDALVMKLSPDGTVQWAQSFGDETPQSATRVVTDAQRNVYVTGACAGTQGDAAWTFGSDSIECDADEIGGDGFLAKLSPEGEPLWVLKAEHAYGNADVVVTPEGNLAVMMGHPTPETSDVVKLDPNGTELWRVEVQGSVVSVAVGLDGNIVVVGDMDFTGMFVATLDPSGQLVSRFEYPGVEWYGQQLAVDQNGELLLAGRAASPVLLQSTTLPVGALFVVKVSAEGEERWVHVAETSQAEASWQSASVDALGNAVLTADWSGTVDFGLGALSSVEGDAVLVKLRGDDGTALWQMSFGSGPAADSANAIASDGAHTHYVAGGFTSYAVTIGETTLENATQDGWAWDGLVFQISE